MPDPINYLAQLPQTNPLANFAQSFGQAAQIQQVMQARQQQQQQMQRQSAYQQAAQEAFATRDPNRFLELGVKFPEFGEQAQSAFKALDTQRQENEFAKAGEVLSALQSGNVDIAKQVADEQITAAKNAGQDVSKLQRVRDAIDKDPNAAASFLMFGMSQAAPDKFKSLTESLAKAGEERRSAQLQPDVVAAKRRENVPSSILEAIDFGNLTPQQQATFVNLQTLKKPPAAVTKVEITNLEKTASAELGKLVPDLYETANAAAGQAEEIPRYREALKKAITGPLADQRLSVARIGDALGFKGDKSVEATREVIQGLSEMALQSRKALTGQGQITEGEQKLLLKARSGDISFTKGELEVIFGVADRAAKAQYDKSTKLLKSASPKSETAQVFLENVKPFPSAAAPQSPAASQPPRNITVDY